MRKSPNLRVEKFRVTNGLMASHAVDGNNGIFIVPLNSAYALTVVISDQEGWEHVSVSLKHRCPTWEEMTFVKDMFFRDDEVVMELHPRKADYVNCHPFCLHMWRPLNAEIPCPPSIMVGPREHVDSHQPEA